MNIGRCSAIVEEVLGDKFVKKASSSEKLKDFSKFKLVDYKLPSGYLNMYIPVGEEAPVQYSVIEHLGSRYFVFEVSTPEDIERGRGGPVARSMRENGIGFSVKLIRVKE